MNIDDYDNLVKLQAKYISELESSNEVLTAYKERVLEFVKAVESYMQDAYDKDAATFKYHWPVLYSSMSRLGLRTSFGVVREEGK